MLKLIDGYAATARHEDVITTGRQFLELFPDDPLANEARDRLATAFERSGRGPARRDTCAATSGGTAATPGHGIRALRLVMAANNAAGLQAGHRARGRAWSRSCPPTPS